jgi:hypothetical protein
VKRVRLALLVACNGLPLETGEESNEPEPGEIPPEIVSIDVPEWPPIGRGADIAVEVHAEEGLDSLRFDFIESYTVTLHGTRDVVRIGGEPLGEAYGPLHITLTDLNGVEHDAWIHDLLVDLTHPEMELGREVLRADGTGASGELTVWAGDAWILGEVGIEIGDTRLVHSFPAGRPDGFGELWDWSLVRWNATELPVGRSEARLWVTDAAGNETARRFELLVDANAPSVAITEPAAGSELSGAFVVRATASDPESEPVWLELYVGGSFAAEAAGPEAAIWLDARDFASGAVDLAAVASDRAGNRSEPATVTVTLR